MGERYIGKKAVTEETIPKHRPKYIDSKKQRV